MMRTQKKFFRDIKGTSFKAFQAGIAVVDPDTPQRIAQQARQLKASDTVMFCTYTDGWSPEAQKFRLGRKCLQQVLSNSRCKVRILTKNVAVRDDFDLIQQYAGRIELSMSLTAPPYAGPAPAFIACGYGPILFKSPVVPWPMPGF